TVTHSALQMGLGLAGAFAGVGALALIAGLGLLWAIKGRQGFEGIEVTAPAMPKEETLAR
ncbi:MAG TPA: hypothetical protein VLB85_11665, partial [Acidimicrobiia bacterium]|nr:hypothetical protein [Acidimicrobiia bacterium]HSJ35698.1 hypothetical protein [Acidimicrobiia bacterium]